jgi:two-component system, cell cycle sensor histidine kinase and response regulator CckA
VGANAVSPGPDHRNGIGALKENPMIVNAFRSLASIVAEPMLLVGPDGTIEAANPAFAEQLLAGDQPGTVGRLADLVQEPHDRLAAFLDACRTAQTPVTDVLRFHHSPPRPYRCSGVAFASSGQDSDRWVVLRLALESPVPPVPPVQAVRMLADSEEKVRVILEHVPDFIVVLDRAGTIEFINQILPGYRMEEVVGSSTFQYVDPRYHTSVREILNQLFETGESYQIEVVGAGSPGEECVYLSRFLPLRREGRITAALNVATDITKLKRIEQSLRESNERIGLILTNALDGIITIDADSRILDWNPQAEAIFGWAREDILGVSLAERLLHPHSRPIHLEGMARYLASGDGRVVNRRMELKALHRAGHEVIVEVAITALRQDDTVTFCAFVRDLTAVRTAEEERQRLEAQIQYAQKLESLGVLAGGIAHDFNNLLTAILGNASLVSRTLPVESPARPMLEQIEAGTLRAAELTRQLLAYAGKGKFLIQRLDLSRLVEEMATLLRTAISKKAVFRFDFARKLPAVEGDATQLRQVVMNLLTNASDAVGEKSGFIAIRTGVLVADHSYLQTAYVGENLAEGEYVFLEVSDTGCGMAPETLGRIFDPFFTTKFTGRGLGLAAVLGIVRGHKGTIKVYSEVGKGTTFKVLLPCSPHAAEHVERADAARQPWRGRGTILVVDDEPGVRDVARRVLESAGFNVLLAADGRQGLELFEQNPAAIRCVVLDLTMPRLGGEDTFREMKVRFPEVRVVLMSGYTEQEVTAHFAGKGLAGFMQKPFRAEDLLSKVRLALDLEPPAGQVIS